MKYKSINNREYESGIILEDYKKAEKYKNLSLGDKFLFFKKAFTLYYISYESLKCAFRRVMVVPIGKKSIEVDYLIIADKRNELAQIQLAGHNEAAAIIDKLKVKAPDASFVCSDRLKR